MKNIFKCAAAVTMAAALACSAGCTGDTKWSFKTDHLSLTSGMWISYTFDGVNNALQKVKETDENATLETMDFNKQEIDGQLAKDWAYADAKKQVIRYLTLDKLAADLGAEVSEETFNSSKYYYSYFYKNYYSEMYEKLVEKLCSAGAGSHTVQHTRPCDKAVVIVYATFWKCIGCFCHHGADRDGGACHTPGGIKRIL